MGECPGKETKVGINAKIPHSFVTRCPGLTKMLHRSASKHDLASTSRARKAVQLNYVDDENRPYYKNDCAWTSIVVPPDVAHLKRSQKLFVYDHLFDKYALNSLEECHAINWCQTIAPMMPMNTMGDGNCLLHATSLFLWGYHDRSLDLRRSIYDALVRDSKAQIRLRWHAWRERANKDCSDSMKVSYDTKTWRQEWIMLLNAVDPNALDQQRLESLEEIHIFVLANVLRRPIIVLSQREILDLYGQPLQPVTMGGIYLPLLCDPLNCCKTPVVIGFADGHFTPMLFVSLASGEQLMQVVPLVRYGDFNPLPVHFIDASTEIPRNLCEDYLELVKIEIGATSRRTIKVAACFSQPPLHQNLIDNYVHYLIDEEKRNQPPPPPLPPTSSKMTSSNYMPPSRPTLLAADAHSNLSSSSNSPRRRGDDDLQFIHCVTPGCRHFGSKDRLNMCSECYSVHRRTQASSSSSSYSSSSSTAVAGQVVSHKCRTSGCGNYGAKERGYLCSECSQQATLLQKIEQRRRREAEETTEKRRNRATTHIKCHTKGCNFFGNPELNFYCSKCFNDMTIAEHERHRRERRMMKDPIAVTSPPPPPPPPDPASLPKPVLPVSAAETVPPYARDRCRESGCNKRGFPDNYNYCEDCFAKSIERYHNSRIPTSQFPPPPRREERASAASAAVSRPIDIRQNAVSRNSPFAGDDFSKKPSEKIVKTKRPSQINDDIYSSSPCRTEGCALFAPKNSKYCLDCQKVEKDTGVAEPVKRVVATQQRCRGGHHCSRLGNAHYQGYCSQCYFAWTGDGKYRGRPMATTQDVRLKSAIRTKDIPCMDTNT